MTGSVVYGLLLSTKILDAIAHRPITFALHQDLASVGLGLAAVHGMLLALDKTVPFTLAQIAVPGLAPYAPIWVAAGQVAFYLMAIVVGSFYVRRQIGQRAWRTLHYVTFLAFVGATVHGVMAGTDSGHAVGLVDLRRLDDRGRVPADVPDRPVGQRTAAGGAVPRDRLTLRVRGPTPTAHPAGEPGQADHRQGDPQQPARVARPGGDPDRPDPDQRDVGRLHDELVGFGIRSADEPPSKHAERADEGAPGSIELDWIGHGLGDARERRRRTG